MKSTKGAIGASKFQVKRLKVKRKRFICQCGASLWVPLLIRDKFAIMICQKCCLKVMQVYDTPLRKWGESQSALYLRKHGRAK